MITLSLTQRYHLMIPRNRLQRYYQYHVLYMVCKAEFPQCSIISEKSNPIRFRRPKSRAPAPLRSSSHLKCVFKIHHLLMDCDVCMLCQINFFIFPCFYLFILLLDHCVKKLLANHCKKSRKTNEILQNTQ